MSILEIRDTRIMTKRDKNKWLDRWPSFSPYELDSDNWSLKVDMDALDAIQNIRNELNRPIRITSAYRTQAHNKRVGGRLNSQHLKGLAFDIACPSPFYARRVEQLAISHGFTAIGRYPAKHFIHIDMRSPKASGKLYRWGGSWDNWK